MADDKERLSGSAAKAKRNLLFLAALTWALAMCWVRPRSGSNTVSLAGVGLDTDINFILWGLVAFLGYNVFSFLLHGPFGSRRALERHWHLLHPRLGFRANANDLFEHLSASVGPRAIPNRAGSHQELDAWLSQRVEGGRWGDSDKRRDMALRALWNQLDWRSRMWLRLRALQHRTARLLVVEDFFDVWVPLLAGISALLVAIPVAFWRLT